MAQGSIARDVHVRGRVQGVAYRWTTQVQADSLGVAGWVRNEPGGSVRAHLEGAPEAVEALIAWMRHGPTGAHVTHLAESPGAMEGARDFRVRY